MSEKLEYTILDEIMFQVERAEEDLARYVEKEDKTNIDYANLREARGNVHMAHNILQNIQFSDTERQKKLLERTFKFIGTCP